MKISVIYHSISGNTERIAKLMAEGAAKSGAVDVKSMNIDEVDEAFLAESRAVIIGCPTHRGGLSWQMKKWISTTKLKMAGKLCTVFATEGYIGGGGDFAEIELITQLLVMGALVYSGGTSQGQPYAHYGVIAIKDGDDAQKERARIVGERVAAKALELFGRG